MIRELGKFGEVLIVPENGNMAFLIGSTTVVFRLNRTKVEWKLGFYGLFAIVLFKS